MSDSEIEDTTYHTDDEWLYQQWELAREAEKKLEENQKVLLEHEKLKLEKENKELRFKLWPIEQTNRQLIEEIQKLKKEIALRDIEDVALEKENEDKRQAMTERMSDEKLQSEIRLTGLAYRSDSHSLNIILEIERARKAEKQLEWKLKCGKELVADLEKDNIELVTRGVTVLERSLERATKIKKLEKENDDLRSKLQDNIIVDVGLGKPTGPARDKP